MNKKNILLLVIIIVLLVGVGAAIAATSMWNKPLGPSLDLPTYTPPVLERSPKTAIPAALAQATQAITSTQVLSATQSAALLINPTATLQPLCNGPTSMTILLIGSDQRGTDYRYGLGDSIHVARIDFTLPNMMVIDFPRDLWVEIPGISDHYGITHAKLNEAYLFGNPGMGYYDGPGEGPGLMARTLDVNFGLRVDHYLALNTETFVAMVDAVGGVDITTDTPIDISTGGDPTDLSLHLSVGTNHLDGRRALILARNRIPSTFQRMKWQKMILSALREKLLTPEMAPQLPKLVTQFIRSVQTDLTPNEINSLLCIGKSLPGEKIKMDSFPQDMFKASDIYDPYRRTTTFIYETDFTKLRAMVAEFMNGIWPMP